MEFQQVNLGRLAKALAYLDPNCPRDDWKETLMGIKSGVGEAGRDLAERWSEGGDSYNKKDFNDTWRSIKEDGGVTIATVFFKAGKNGWTDNSKRRPTPPTPEEIAQRETNRKAAEDERKARREAAAIESATIWSEAHPAPTDHPYLKRKGVQPHGARIYHGDKIIGDIRCNGALLMPMYLNKKITGLQFITEEGKKLFLPGAEKGGCMIGKAEPGKPVCICEGFATGATIHEATGYPVIVAFDAGNLCKMALAFRAKNPNAMIILCADDDVSKTGQRRAEEAALAVGGLLALPEFGESRPDNATDFNDMEKHCGPEAVKRVIDVAIQANQNHNPIGSDTSALNSAGDTNTATEMQKTIAEPTGADIETLALLDTLEYEQQRKEQAKALKVRPTVLDKLVKDARSSKKESSQLPFKEVDPWPDPIDPEQLLDDVTGTIKRFIVLDDEQALAAALWIAQTWFIDVLQVAPLALINAPEKACGKSQLLDVMGRMSAKPISAANSSTAFMFRAVEQWTPTVLIDEADTFIKENEELKGLINAGHTRAQAYVGRVVGDNHEPRMFKVWGAKALAGIQLEKHLPDATMSRGIIFNLRRKLPHEAVEKLRHAEPGLFDNLAAKLARFALDYSGQVRDARPDLPGELSDRDQDNWSGLLVIASCAGDERLEKATAAAKKLSKADDKPASTGNELLDDIRQVFENKGVDKISTADLIAALCEDEEAPWSTYNRGKPIAPRQVASRLSMYSIKSKTIRIGYGTAKGFELSQFNDAFARYLDIPPLAAPGNLPSQGNVTPEANNHRASSVTDRENVTVTQCATVTPEPPSSLDCYVVTDIYKGAESEVSF